MSKALSDILYIRKRERKSLLMVLSLLLFSSFSDDIYVVMKHKIIMERSAQNTTDHSPKVKIPIQASGSENPTTAIKPSIISKTQHDEKLVTENSKSDSTRILKKVELSAIASTEMKVEKSKLQEKKMPLDPNTATVQDLVKLGVKKYAAENWVKFTNAGAKIHSKKDLEKVYGLEAETLEKINHLMLYPVREQKFKKKPLLGFDVNAGTALDFASIPGIGKILSERIVKFRDKLGGFHSTDQLLEVYGIVDTVILKHDHFLEINLPVKKINVNSGSEKELSIHPYINYKAAKVIVNYRRQHGSFSQSEDLADIRIFDTKWISKISPYLEF